MSASDDGTVRAWDLKTGAALHVFGGHTKWVRALAVSRDGGRAVSGSDDGTVRVWDLRNGRLLHALEGHAGIVRSVAISRDGTVLSASDDSTLRIWSSSGELLHCCVGHSAWVRSVSCSPDGRIALTGGYDRTARLWDVSSGVCIATLSGHPGWIRSVALVVIKSPSGTSFDGEPTRMVAVTASYDATMRVWAVPSGELLHVLQGHDDILMAVSATPDGSTLLSASTDLTVRAWGLRDGRQLLRMGHTAMCLALASSPDGRRALSAGADGLVRVFDVQSGAQLAAMEGHLGWVRCVACAADGLTAVSGGGDGALRLWCLREYRQLRAMETGALVISLALHPDDATLLSGGSDLLVRLYALATGALLRTWAGHGGWVRSLSCTPDGASVVSSSGDQTLRLWRFPEGVQQLQMGFTEQQRRDSGAVDGHRHIIPGVICTPDGLHCASASYDRTLRLWDLSSGAELSRMLGHSSWVRTVATLGPDRLASSSYDRTARIWDYKGQELLSIPHHSYVLSVVATPDASTLLTGCEDGSIYIHSLSPTLVRLHLIQPQSESES
ncbi:MAG: WD40 repeat domain-containing protein [archaeon]|nr:WD40 repeat domain-containing protein [archaeon]